MHIVFSALFYSRVLPWWRVILWIFYILLSTSALINH